MPTTYSFTIQQLRDVLHATELIGNTYLAGGRELCVQHATLAQEATLIDALAALLVDPFTDYAAFRVVRLRLLRDATRGTSVLSLPAVTVSDPLRS